MVRVSLGVVLLMYSAGQNYRWHIFWSRSLLFGAHLCTDGLCGASVSSQSLVFLTAECVLNHWLIRATGV